VTGSDTQVKRDHKDLYVYEPSGGSSPFEVFLGHTNEKREMSKFLGAQVIALDSVEELRILDIGSGDSSLAMSMLTASGKDLSTITYEAVEPVEHNTSLARRSLASLSIANCIHETRFEDYRPQVGKAYEMILASNLYHLTLDEIPDFIVQARSMLVPSTGLLYFVYRDSADDILEFRSIFESRMYGKDFIRPRTINDVFGRLSEHKIAHQSSYSVGSELKFPQDPLVYNKLVEFILNHDPRTLGQGLQDEIHQYLEVKNFALNTRHAVVTFTTP
jgi:hypothetical protein